MVEKSGISLPTQGPHCHCGRCGFLDTVAGGLVLHSKVKAANLVIRNTRNLARSLFMATRGPLTTTRCRYSSWNGCGITCAHNNPQCILFTDFEGFGNEVFRTATRQTVENNVMARFWVRGKSSSTNLRARTMCRKVHLSSTCIPYNDIERSSFLPKRRILTTNPADDRA
jgi:hypothetical protein